MWIANVFVTALMVMLLVMLIGVARVATVPCISIIFPATLKLNRRPHLDRRNLKPR
jgi:hypothetical protein